ncbi:FecCD family ABC transporter permease [Hominifimenecus sp. rT4P-3]|uniref:FecCD family ABC transporter permease n=1 Tax=Hominifimenecus sp. rT4P-3 TaxID=3242979 RepID=UPI003DA506C0
MKQRKGLSPRIAMAGTGILIAVLFFVSICIGQYPISLSEIWGIFRGGMEDTMAYQVFYTLRLPRTILALMAGMAMGVAGSIYQIIFKNPLASPDIIGVTAGANLGAAAAILFLGGSAAALAGGAFIGGILVVLLVMALVRVTGLNQTSTYVLAGIVMSAISKALIMTLKYFADPLNELAAIEFWTMGSLAQATRTKLLVVAPLFLVSLAGLFLLRRQIGLMALNEDECRMLGVRIRPVRLSVLLLSTLLVASVVSVTGLIAFIGLVVPHIARLMIKRSGTALTVLSGLMGGAILIPADCLARSLGSAEIPISILTTFLAVPFLFYLMCRQKGGVR